MGNILLHFLISDRVGNVPTLRPLGLIRIFSFQTNTQKHNVDMLVNGMCPLLIPGF